MVVALDADADADRVTDTVLVGADADALRVLDSLGVNDANALVETDAAGDVDIDRDASTVAVRDDDSVGVATTETDTEADVDHVGVGRMLLDKDAVPELSAGTGQSAREELQDLFLDTLWQRSLPPKKVE